MSFRQRPVVAAVRNELSVDSSDDRGMPVTKGPISQLRPVGIERLSEIDSHCTYAPSGRPSIGRYISGYRSYDCINETTRSRFCFLEATLNLRVVGSIPTRLTRFSSVNSEAFDSDSR